MELDGQPPPTTDTQQQPPPPPPPPADLARGSSGPDVVALQNFLFQEGYRISEKEQGDKFFGDTTYDALVDYQKKHQLVPTGIFDAKARWVLDDDHQHPNKFIVIGQVFDANGQPKSDVTVQAFDKDIRSEQLLDTDSNPKQSGEYLIMYRADKFAALEKGRADLFVKVFDKTGALLATSPVIFNAGKVEVVNVTIGNRRGLSEFERIVNEIQPVINGVVTHAGLTTDDISFLNGETGIDTDLLTLLAESARRNVQEPSIAQTTFYGLFRQGFPTDLEALLENEIEQLRAALEISSNDGIIPPLTAAQLDQIAANLQALKARIILQPGLPGETSLGDLLKTSSLTLQKQQIVADLYVQNGGTTDAFWAAIDARSDLLQADKDDVRFTLQVGGLTSRHIPLVLELRPPAGTALIVTPSLNGAALSEDASALRPFVVKDVAAWKLTLQKLQAAGKPVAPPSIPGSTDQEKIDNYAAALNQYMEKALPTPMIAARADQDTAVDNPFLPVKTDLKTFFANTVNKNYEFRKTPIDVYLSEGRTDKLRGVVNPTALIAELKNMQRLFNITPRYAEIRSFRKDDLHSAMSMVKLGERRFTEKYSATLGGSATALATYRKAQQTHAIALNFYLNNAVVTSSPVPAAIRTGDSKVTTLATASASPDLPTLFGSLDLCECDQCQSLYSPAAYYVDILKFLSDGPLKKNLTPLEVLFGRRPDLEHLELTCDNTTTQVPYVDLAREILEHEVKERRFEFVVPGNISDVRDTLTNKKEVPDSFPAIFANRGYSLAKKASVRPEAPVNGQVRSWLILDSSWAFKVDDIGTGSIFAVLAWPQTSWTADELRANPEHVHGPAYAKLRQAVYPWDLPLNQPVEESRVYLGHFGVKRAEVLETFLGDMTPDALTEHRIANERLGFTQQEVDIITGVTTGAPDDNDPTTSEGAWDFWGLKETGNDIADPTDGTAPHATGTWDVVLKRVSIFLLQSGLSYRDLLELLGSYYINPATTTGTTGRTLGIISNDPDPSVCNLSKFQIQVVDPQVSDADKPAALKAAFNRMHRFARLWRKLGWTMRDLDKAMMALQPKNNGKLDLTADFMVQLSHIERLRAQFNLPVVNLLSFWAAIDTGRYIDHFAEGEPAVPTLYAQLFNNKSASGQSLGEDPLALTGKLSENKSTIAAAVQVSVDDLNLLLADTRIVPNDTLNLDNLSKIYSHATFARALKYSIRTYLSTLKLIAADPFVDAVTTLASTTTTISFIEQAEKILASGFSIEELDYLLRHDFSAVSNIAISDDVIALVLSAIRDEVQKIAAENEFVAVASDATAATNDPNGDLTKRKLALLNWDGALIEQLVSVLNGAFTHETGLASLPVNDFPAELRGRLTYDSIAAQLRFTGVMTMAERDRLLGVSSDANYTDAVRALFNAPRNMVARHMARFSVPRFTAPLASMPDIVIPSAIKSKIFFDGVAHTLNFDGVMTDAERKALIDAEPKVPSTPAPPLTPYAVAIQALFDAGGVAPTGNDIFITAADVTAMFIDTATPASRFLIVLQTLLPHLRTMLSERIVIQRIGGFLQFDSQTANDMLTRWVNSPAGKAIDELLAPSFTESNPNVAVTRSVFGTQFETIARLYKISLVGAKFRLSGQEFQWLFDYRSDNNWLDLNALPLLPTATAYATYNLWSRTADLVQLRNALPNGEALLTDIFTTAHSATPPLATLLDKISEGTGWKLDKLQALNTGFSIPAGAYKDEVAMRRLQSAFAMLDLIGASAQQCLDWAGATTEIDETKSAHDIKSLVRAKLDSTEWLEVAKNLNDPLRERQRAALVSYLVPEKNVRDANELYDYFLIDVEMSPCMMTTRIKQAISSVQLFIQRSLMNLEEDVFMTPKEAREWAQWRKQYRIWEANRKILLYPENWIEPELRDGKSQFFEQMQDELLQSDVTMDSAETAFVHYLEKLQEVGRLEIVGMYHETEAATSTTSAVDVMHVIGRTYSAPHVHYYRRQIDSASWTPWVKVEADIQGNHLVPVIWNRSLYLFWPVFTTKQEDKPFTMPAAGAAVTPAAKKLEIQIAWTEYKNGKWSPKKLTAPYMSKKDHPEASLTDDFKFFSFKTRTKTTDDGQRQLFLDCYGSLEVVSTEEVVSGETFEKHLFSMGVPGTRTVYASLNGELVSAAQAKNLQIIVRDFDNNRIDPPIPFTDFGWVVVRNTINSYRKYSLSSAAYVVEDVTFSGSERICAPAGTSTNFLGSNGHSLESLSIETKTPALSSLVGTQTLAVTPLTESSTRIICENTPDTICDVELAAVQTSEGTVTTSTADPMQSIVTFIFDEGQQSLIPLENSTPVPSIEPIIGTQFENMMMVECNNTSDGFGQLLQKTPGKFRLLGMHQSYTAKNISRPFFFQDDLHAYYVVDANGKARFNPFYNANVSRFSKSLNRFGIDGLLTLANQRLIDDPNKLVFGTYLPNSTYVDLNGHTPRENVDFEYDSAYSIYNWELFFHAPFMIATQLSKNQRFEEAQKWFHYIFDPTTTDSPDQQGDPGSERFWRVQPFYEVALRGPQTLAELFEDDSFAAQIREWQANPFSPHVIARLRKVAYMKAVVMHYIDNLIEWGDQLFRRDTIESINEATQLYILAAQILGRRPEQIPPRAKAKVQTYRTLDDIEALNSLANATVEIEGFLPPAASSTPAGNGDGEVVFEGEGEEPISVVPSMPFFAIPGNDKLLGYWDTVGDRLFKIRHCMNIDGGVRSLAIFEPPIDPALLVRAAGAGVDIASALSDINVALPNYRFSVMSQKAAELCGEVKALGGALLSALEKRDAEAMALLRSTHELKVLKAVRSVKEKQLAEATEARVGLDRSKELTTMRRDYYRDIAFMNQWEKNQLALASEALFLQDVEVNTHILASFLHLVPNLKTALPSSMGITYGGENIGNAMNAFGDSLAKISGLLNSRASMAATMGGHQRRFDDWKLQERLANKELEQLETQIAAADIRKAIAEKELSNHDLQVQNTREVDEFMRSKFTNRELYDWMVGQLSGIYFQSYQLAYDVAKRAERAYRYELGLRDSSFIQFGYWDSLKKGLLAGERLAYDLKHMEVSYLEKNQREYEIVKHISLQSIDPVSLVRLKQTGECFVTLPETLFDVDYAGHYMRRIKSVGITVPCVAGPYTGINCTLTLQGSSIRHRNGSFKDKYARQADDPRFADSAGTRQSIVTSGAQNDSGLFEPNLRDERYLPFEGQGAISTWHLELPKNFKTFDYNTISDVVLHMRYTARDGGSDLRTKAQDELQTALNEFVRSEGKQGLTQMFSLRHEFGTEWSRFLSSVSGFKRSVTMPLTRERFPFLFQGGNITINEIELFVKVKPGVGGYTKGTIKLTLGAGDTASGNTLTLDEWNSLVRGAKSFSNAPGAFTLNAWRNDTDEVEANAIQDILVVCRYTVS